MTSKNNIRMGFISGNAFRQILVSLFGMAIPFFVIRFSSKEVWGAFVSFLLFALITVQIINWGNKEYLLRAFSLRPNTMKHEYSRVLFTRLPLVFAFALIAVFYFGTDSLAWISIWLFGRYLGHSVEALVVYQKAFNKSIAIELVCFVLFCAAFFSNTGNLTLLHLLAIYSLYQLLKGLMYFALFLDFFSWRSFAFSWSYYQSGLPFFMLSILGFLASKADVYLIENLGNTIVTADYQIINSLLVFTMSMAAFIYSPFTKNLYRNTEAVIGKAQKALSILGLVVVPASLLAIALILYYYLALKLSIFFYMAAFAYIYPSFIYGIEVVNLFRLHMEKTVVRYLFVGAVSNTVLSAIFLYCGFGMTGALTGSAMAQLIVLFLFKFKPAF